ncbi:MAG: SH3 domain-containing protein [Anaerolineae bacterium]|nr:SH3 domain-containing protein [Anaerolineae bacterium]
MAIKHKNIEVSAKKSLFGGSSEMDKEVEKWTSQGWTLTNTTASSRKNYYLLSFEYEPEEDEEKGGTSRRGIGCAIAVGVIVALAAVCNVINSPPITKELAKPSLVAQVATQTMVVKPTQSPNKNQSIQTSTDTLVKTKISSTLTVTPTRILPSATPEPTAVLASVKSGNINARSCASTDCGIVKTVVIGDKISIAGADGNWYLVMFEDGNKGYIRQDLLVVPDGVEVAVAPTRVPTRTSIPTEVPIRFGEPEVLISIKTVMFSQGYTVESIEIHGHEIVVDAPFSPNDSFDDADANVQYQFSVIGILLGSTVTAYNSDYTVVKPPNKFNVGFTLAGIRIYHVLINYSDAQAFIQHKITAEQLQNRMQVITD